MKIEVECTLCLQGPEGIIPNVDCPVHGFSRVRALLMEFVEGEDSPCRFDHHGYCQENWSFGEPGECLNKDAREAVGFDA
jgi:hypothetical protein